MFKRFLMVLVVCILIFSLSFISMAKIEWIMASKYSSTSLQGQYYQNLADQVKEMSEGEFVIEVFTSETLGGTDAILDQLQNGDVNLYPEGVGYLQRFYAPFGIFELPFIFKDTNHWVNFFKSEMVEKWKDELVKYDLTVLGALQPLDPFRVLFSNKPIHSYNDFKGMKLRMFPSEAVVGLWTYLGANVIVLEYTDVYEGLRTGLVEGVTAPIIGGLDMSFHEPARFILRTDEYPQGIGWIMNKSGYDELSNENKEILNKAWDLAGKWAEEKYAELLEGKIKKAIEEQNIQLLRMNMSDFAKKAWEYYPQLEKDGFLPQGTLEYIANMVK